MAAENELVKRDQSGRFQPGHHLGRPRKGNSIRDLLRLRPIKDKRALTDVAYAEALKGRVDWAEWIVKHSGESGAANSDGLTRELIYREYGFNANDLDAG